MKLRSLLPVLTAAVLALAATAQEVPTPPSARTAPPAPPEARQFDFWLGDWEVWAANGRKAGDNRIESILDGHVLRETYQTPGFYRGTSTNAYHAAQRRWEQYWVDNTGLVLHLTGGLNTAGEMVLSGAGRSSQGAPTVERITWTPNADGTVRQHWEQSADGGKTWSTAFDGLYKRKAK